MNDRDKWEAKVAAPIEQELLCRRAAVHRIGGEAMICDAMGKLNDGTDCPGCDRCEPWTASTLSSDELMAAFPTGMRAVRVPPGWRQFARNIERAVLAKAAAEAEHWQKISEPSHRCGEYIAAALRSMAKGGALALVPVEPTLAMKAAMASAFDARKPDGTVAHELNRAKAAHKAMLGAAPVAAEPADNIKELVNRFLTWPVPASVNPDGVPGQPGRTGTNLLSAQEAEEMLRYVLGLPAATVRDCSTDSCRCDECCIARGEWGPHNDVEDDATE